MDSSTSRRCSSNLAASDSRNSASSACTCLVRAGKQQHQQANKTNSKPTHPANTVRRLVLLARTKGHGARQGPLWFVWTQRTAAVSAITRTPPPCTAHRSAPPPATSAASCTAAGPTARLQIAFVLSRANDSNSIAPACTVRRRMANNEQVPVSTLGDVKRSVDGVSGEMNTLAALVFLSGVLSGPWCWCTTASGHTIRFRQTTHDKGRKRLSITTGCCCCCCCCCCCECAGRAVELSDGPCLATASAFT